MAFIPECSHEWCVQEECKCDCHQYLFTIDELKALYGILEREWINPENVLGHATVNRIMKIIRDYDKLQLDRGVSSST